MMVAVLHLSIFSMLGAIVGRSGNRRVWNSFQTV